MDKLEIIYRISRLRIKANLSARALSQRCELNDGYINRLESKKNFLPSMEVLLRIIKECNSTPEAFFYHDMEAYSVDMQTIKLLEDLDVETKIAVTQLIFRIKHGKFPKDYKK